MNKTGALRVATLGDRDIVMTRVFDAPRTLVFDAWTQPELLKAWFGGPRDWTLEICEIDLRPGGAYRFVTRRSDGTEMGWGGVYRDCMPPERIVFTELFDEPWYSGEALIMIILAEQGGRTTFTSTILYDSEDVRDSVLASPMERGVAENFVRLDEFLARLQAEKTSKGDTQ